MTMPVGLLVVLWTAIERGKAFWRWKSGGWKCGSLGSRPKCRSTRARASAGSMSPKTVTTMLLGTKYRA